MKFPRKYRNQVEKSRVREKDRIFFHIQQCDCGNLLGTISATSLKKKKTNNNNRRYHFPTRRSTDFNNTIDRKFGVRVCFDNKISPWWYQSLAWSFLHIYGKQISCTLFNCRRAFIKWQWQKKPEWKSQQTNTLWHVTVRWDHSYKIHKSSILTQKPLRAFRTWCCAVKTKREIARVNTFFLLILCNTNSQVMEMPLIMMSQCIDKCQAIVPS